LEDKLKIIEYNIIFNIEKIHLIIIYQAIIYISDYIIDNDNIYTCLDQIACQQSRQYARD